MIPAAASIWFLTSVALLFASRKTIRSGGTPYLINIGGKRLIPLMSSALLSLIFLLGVTALKITDIAITDFSAWQDENQTRIIMTVDKTYPTMEAVRIGIRENSISDNYFSPDELIGLDYPLTRLSAKAAGTGDGCRIAVIGDSFVWGESLINQNSVMYRQLEYELIKRGYDCTVYGIGVGGASTFDEYVWLEGSTLLEDLKPDIVLIGYVRNDPELQSRQSAYGTDGAVSGIKKLLSLPANAIDDFCPDIGYLLSNRLHSSEYMALNVSYVGAENLAAYEEEVVKPMSALFADKNTRLAFVSFPRITESPYNNKFYPPVKELYESHGIPFHDCTAEYTDFFSSKIHTANAAVNPVDLHPGTASNRFFATYMADLLERDHRDLLGQKTPGAEKTYDLTVNDWLPMRLNVTEESVSPEKSVFNLEYPTKGEPNSLLYLPVKKDHVAISFAFPVDIDSITLTGEELESAEIWYNSINGELGYDDMKYDSLGQKQGGACVWTDETGDRVTTLFIHAETAFGDKKLSLKLTVTCGAGGVRP